MSDTKPSARRRRKHSGEPGNGGQFATAQHPPSVLDLDTSEADEARQTGQDPQVSAPDALARDDGPVVLDPRYVEPGSLQTQWHLVEPPPSEDEPLDDPDLDRYRCPECHELAGTEEVDGLTSTGWYTGVGCSSCGHVFSSRYAGRSPNMPF